MQLNDDDDDEEEDERREGSPLASRSRPRPSQIKLRDTKSEHHALPYDDETIASDDDTETATEDSASHVSGSDTEEEEEEVIPSGLIDEKIGTGTGTGILL